MGRYTRKKKKNDGRGGKDAAGKTTCSRGGRTLSSEVCRATIAGSTSGRTEATTTTEGPVERMSRNFFPSHNQLGLLVAKCLPLTHVDCFKSAFEKQREAGLAKKNTWSPNTPTVVKTPVSWINGALISTFGGNCVSLEQCSAVAKDVFALTASEMVGNTFLELILMDCILKRQEPPDSSLANSVTDTPPPMKAYNGVQCTEQGDFRFRTCIAILPGAGAFFCARERRKESEGKLNSHIPMELNWLHLDLKQTGDGQWFLPASYVQCLSNVGEDGICSVWRWRFKREGLLFPGCGLRLRGNNLRLMAFKATQCRDEVGPRLPPDFICGESNAYLGVHTLREEYCKKLLVSNSTRRGCRHYVSGFLHRCLQSDVLIVDPLLTHDVDITVSVQVPKKWNDLAAVSADSVVQVRYLPALSGASVLLDDVRAHAQLVCQQQKGQSVRAGKGDHGTMHPIGSRISPDKSCVMDFVASSTGRAVPILRRAVKASATLASLSIPAVLRVIQDLENDSGMAPPMGMAGVDGSGRISHTMDVSVDLSNSSHYDVNDGSQGFSIWTEDIPGSTEGWYFVLPNVHGKRTDGGGLFNGLAIRLTHGVLISWDGRVIRHCTSVMDRKAHVYGTFYAAKKSIIEHGQQMSAEIVKAKKRKEAEDKSRRKSTKHSRPGPIISDNHVLYLHKTAVNESARATSPTIPRKESIVSKVRQHGNPY